MSNTQYPKSSINSTVPKKNTDQVSEYYPLRWEQPQAPQPEIHTDFESDPRSNPHTKCNDVTDSKRGIVDLDLNIDLSLDLNIDFGVSFD